MDIAARIHQFETMVRPEADPDNDMAWFSLGQAYAAAGRHRDAANAFARCTTLNPAMSKAYQLAGQSLIELGDTQEATRVLSQGFTSAAARGDRMPQNAMKGMLEQLGAPVPTIESKAAPGRVGGGDMTCARTGQPGHKMPRAPFRGPVGRWIHEHITQETFDAWLRQGTKVINELRLDMSREDDADTYDRHMREYLGIDDEMLRTLTPGKDD